MTTALAADRAKDREHESASTSALPLTAPLTTTNEQPPLPEAPPAVERGVGEDREARREAAAAAALRRMHLAAQDRATGGGRGDGGTDGGEAETEEAIDMGPQGEEEMQVGDGGTGIGATGIGACVICLDVSAGVGKRGVGERGAGRERGEGLWCAAGQHFVCVLCIEGYVLAQSGGMYMWEGGGRGQGKWNSVN